MPIFGTNSSINAVGYGFLGSKQRTIETTIAPRNLTEGNVITVTVTSDGIEGFVIDIRETSHTSAVIETTQSVYIQGSTSTGVGGVDDGQGGSTFHDFGGDGNLVFDANTSTSYTYTAATDVKFKAYLWGQGGRCATNGSLGGHSYGTFNLTQGDQLHIRLNYGASNAGSGSGSGANAACGLSLIHI